MTKLVWENVGRREYWPGLDHSVLYIPTDQGEDMCGAGGIEDDRPFFEKLHEIDDIVAKANEKVEDNDDAPDEPRTEIKKEEFEELLGIQLSDWQWKWVTMFNAGASLKREGPNFVIIPRRK